MSEPPASFAASAIRLGGMAAVILGWRPDDFWRATPAELESVLAVIAPPGEAAGDAALVARLKEIFPDG